MGKECGKNAEKRQFSGSASSQNVWNSAKKLDLILVTLKAPSLFSRRAGVVVWQAGLAQLKKHSSKNVLIL